MTRIFEITMFWNEDALFRARIENTLSYAERLHIAEGNESHSGAIKREYRLPQLIRDLPNELRSRVIPVLVPMSEHVGKTPFAREKIVRDAASTQLLQDQKLSSEDFLFVTDFDEFIHPVEAQKIQHHFPWYAPFRRGIRLKQRLTFFRLNLLSPDDWTLAICLRGDELSHPDFSANQWRHEWAKKRLPITREFTGWHHSYYGDVAFIKNKIQSFAEANIDMVRQLTDDQILHALDTGTDLYGRGQAFQKINYLDWQPIPALEVTPMTQPTHSKIRLEQNEINAIVKGIHDNIPDGQLLSIHLYGSRTNPLKKGGDIDLWITLNHTPKPNEIHDVKANILYDIINKLGEQKIDLKITGPYESLESTDLSFFNIVKHSMIELWTRHTK